MSWKTLRRTSSSLPFSLEFDPLYFDGMMRYVIPKRNLVSLVHSQTIRQSNKRINQWIPANILLLGCIERMPNHTWFVMSRLIIIIHNIINTKKKSLEATIQSLQGIILCVCIFLEVFQNYWLNRIRLIEWNMTFKLTHSIKKCQWFC